MLLLFMICISPHHTRCRVLIHDARLLQADAEILVPSPLSTEKAVMSKSFSYNFSAKQLQRKCSEMTTYYLQLHFVRVKLQLLEFPLILHQEVNSMKKPVKVSVLIPAYNVERYIDQCLESAMNQTLREIEIIVVDDCSTDSTLAHIEAAAEKDRRIRVIRHKKNRKLLQSRKTAVLASQGEYVMFLDSDDYLDLDACRTVYESAVKSGADILHFGTSFENCGDLPEEYIQLRETGSNLYQTFDFLGQPLVQNFTRELLSSMVTQKAVKGETAKRAYKKMTDLSLYAAEDEYATCFLLMESSSLDKIPDKLYHYCYGRGAFGHRVVTTQRISFHCDGANAYHELEKYVSKLPPEYGEVFIAAAKDAAKKLRKNALNNQLAAWLNHMNPEDQPNAYLIMEQAWQMGGPGFVGLLAQNAWEEHAKIAKAISGADWLKFEARPIRTVGFYYYKDEDGEPEKAIARLASLLAEVRDESGKPRYRVVLISDEAPNEEDYQVSPLVIREQLPPCHESTAEKYASRAEKWQEIIVRNGIDAVFYSYWLNPYLLWDLLSIKRSERHPAFVLQTRSTCTQLYGLNWIFVKELLHIYSLTDGVVTLSETDRLHWSRCNPGSIPNPDFVKASAARWTSLIESLKKGALPNAPRLDEATEALLDEIDDYHASALDRLARERDQERDNARRLEAERGALEEERRTWETQCKAWEAEREAHKADREALDSERRFWKEELYATRDTVSFRVGRAITWFPRKLRGGVRCYKEHGGKYTFYRLLYHLRLAPNNDGSGGV